MKEVRETIVAVVYIIVVVYIFYYYMDGEGECNNLRGQL